MHFISIVPNVKVLCDVAVLEQHSFNIVIFFNEILILKLDFAYIDYVSLLPITFGSYVWLRNTKQLIFNKL